MTKKTKRCVTITIRLSEAEKGDIDFCTSKLGMTQTELLVNGVQIIKQMIEKQLQQNRTEKKNI